MIETGKIIAEHIEANKSKNMNASKVVVITGALKPERFKDSDAAFNIGGAVVAASAMAPGVYVCMSGTIIDAKSAARDADGKFIRAKSKMET